MGPVQRGMVEESTWHKWVKRFKELDTLVKFSAVYAKEQSCEQDQQKRKNHLPPPPPLTPFKRHQFTSFLAYWNKFDTFCFWKISLKKENKRAIMTLYHSPEYNSIANRDVVWKVMVTLTMTFALRVIFWSEETSLWHLRVLAPSIAELSCFCTKGHCDLDLCH